MTFATNIECDPTFATLNFDMTFKLLKLFAYDMNSIKLNRKLPFYTIHLKTFHERRNFRNIKCAKKPKSSRESLKMIF